MIFDAIETTYNVALANFDNDFAVLCAAKGVSAPAETKIYKHLQADAFIDFSDPLPGLGVDALRAVTQARGQGNRDSTLTGVLDYVVQGSDPTLVAQWGSLGAETCCKLIDRLTGVDTIEGAGHRDGSITVELGPALVEAQADTQARPTYIRRAVVTYEIDDRDTGL